MKQSLQTKLFVSFMIVISVILIGFAVGASALVRQYFLSAKQQELVGKGHEMSTVLNDFMTGEISATSWWNWWTGLTFFWMRESGLWMDRSALL